MKKTGRNEPCWCGSGKKFKYCHLGRERQEAYSTGRLIAELRKLSSHKECLHPEAGSGNCSKKIIAAHSIQKAGPLKHIVDEESHVYTFGQNNSGEEEISRIGHQRASTFRGFCGKHDKEMFSLIEDESYIATEQQSFIAAYRAYALEYFKKVSVIKALPFMKESIDRGLGYEEQADTQRSLHSMNQGFVKGIEDFQTTLKTYTANYPLKSQKEFSSVSMFFTGNLEIVVAGCFSPDFDMNGNRIQHITLDANFIESISMSTLIGDGEFVVVFAWPSNFSSCNKFIKSLLEVDTSTLPSRLVEIMFSYIENSYFSKPWLDNLNPSNRTRIEGMARNPIQYGAPVAFSGAAYTNWNFSRLVRT